MAREGKCPRQPYSEQSTVYWGRMVIYLLCLRARTHGVKKVPKTTNLNKKLAPNPLFYTNLGVTGTFFYFFLRTLKLCTHEQIEHP